MAVTFTPIIKVGELEIDILIRTVRAGDDSAGVGSQQVQQALLQRGQVQLSHTRAVGT